MKLSGAQILIESLKKEGVKYIFGYPGGVVLHIFDVLYDEKDIQLILTRHEQGAAHAADGYARATGKAGVCLVTSGPGATNIVTGIATAYMDSIPMVVITGQVPTMLIGNDAFQEADIVGITRPCTKHNFLVKDVKRPRPDDKGGFLYRHHRQARPGPDRHPERRIHGQDGFQIPGQGGAYGATTRPSKGNLWQMKQAADAIAKSRKPVIIAGGGVISSGAAAELKDLAETAKLPVTMTMMGLGGFPGDHKLSLGMLGMHGTYYANMAVHDSDLLIAIGMRFDDRVTGKGGGFRAQREDNPYRHRPDLHHGRTCGWTCRSWAT